MNSRITDDGLRTSGPLLGSGTMGRLLVHRDSRICRVPHTLLDGFFCHGSVFVSSVSRAFNRIVVESLPSTVSRELDTTTVSPHGTGHTELFE